MLIAQAQKSGDSELMARTWEHLERQGGAKKFGQVPEYQAFAVQTNGGQDWPKSPEQRKWEIEQQREVFKAQIRQAEYNSKQDLARYWQKQELMFNLSQFGEEDIVDSQDRNQARGIRRAAHENGPKNYKQWNKTIEDIMDRNRKGLDEKEKREYTEETTLKKEARTQGYQQSKLVATENYKMAQDEVNDLDKQVDYLDKAIDKAAANLEKARAMDEYSPEAIAANNTLKRLTGKRQLLLSDDLQRGELAEARKRLDQVRQGVYAADTAGQQNIQAPADSPAGTPPPPAASSPAGASYPQRSMDDLFNPQPVLPAEFDDYVHQTTGRRVQWGTLEPNSPEAVSFMTQLHDQGMDDATIVIKMKQIFEANDRIKGQK
jgi:hypothetical protein